MSTRLPQPSELEVPTQAPPIQPPRYDDPDTEVQVVCISDDQDDNRDCHLLMPGSQSMTYCGIMKAGGWNAIHVVALGRVDAPQCEICGRPRCQPCVVAYRELPA